MKLTTPAIASAPYTDEAPPVIVSTRAIAADGIVLMLTAPDALTGMPRRPSSSARLRFAPRPPRCSVAATSAFRAGVAGPRGRSRTGTVFRPAILSPFTTFCTRAAWMTSFQAQDVGRSDTGRSHDASTHYCPSQEYRRNERRHEG